MFWFFDYITVPWVYWTVWILYSLTIFGENRNPVKSLAWVTVLLVVPIVGLVLYIVFGRNIQTKRIISRRNRRKLRKLNATTASKTKKTDCPPHQTRQVNLAQSLCSSTLHTGNEVTLFDNGTDKFNSLLADRQPGDQRFDRAGTSRCESEGDL